jgi:hypothetical protein
MDGILSIEANPRHATFRNVMIHGMLIRSTLAFAMCAFATASPAQTAGTTLAACPSSTQKNPANAVAIAERDRELKVLGITQMKPAIGAFNIGKPCNANYDEALANPYPKLPDALTTRAGEQVSTASQWRHERRQEIIELLQNQVYGFVPDSVPTVTWTVTRIRHHSIGGIAVVTKALTGHVDNRAYPSITVNIRANLVTPADAQGRAVPVIVMNGSRLQPIPVNPTVPLAHEVSYYSLLGETSLQQLLRRGWGYVAIDSTSAQPDSLPNGDGIGAGIIGLANRGKPRGMDQWGAVRAWAWADSRLLDYLVTDPAVDARRIGIFGHSRFGKAALVAMAFDPRFAIGYISAAGAGGSALFRRNFGETLANLTGPGEFYWFAGNLMKYAAVGHSPDELPVDSHELIALCAPRPLFLSGGIFMSEPGKIPGDAWQDTRGTFMAAVAASPVYTLLGAKGLGTDSMPPPSTLIDSGSLAFRQHTEGHTPSPNWPYFLRFAERELAEP